MRLNPGSGDSCQTEKAFADNLGEGLQVMANRFSKGL